MITIFIHPAVTDVASRCVIKAANGKMEDPLRNYRVNPGYWRDIGYMNNAGQITFLAAPKAITESIKECEPLGALETFYFPDYTIDENGRIVLAKCQEAV